MSALKKKLSFWAVAVTIYLFIGCDKTEIAFRDDFDQEQMDAFFSKLEADNLGMGSVAIFKNASLVYQRSFGYADLENDMIASPQTTYKIGSITKTITATIIMQLVEEQKLSLTTPLAEFFPELPNAERITIADLLKHRSGLFNYTEATYDTSVLQQEATNEALIAFVIENGTVFEPNEKAAYSNTNYLVLGFIIEAIDQKPFADALRDRISTPLGLLNLYNGTGLLATEANEALPYTSVANKWVLVADTHSSLVKAAGSVLATPEDLNTFYVNLFAGNIVSQTSLDYMKRLENGFGAGLFALPFYDKTALGHTGRLDGFESYAMHFEADDITVSFALNGVAYPANDIAIAILSIYAGLDFKTP